MEPDPKTNNVRWLQPATVRIDASTIQGEGAFIEFRHYVWAEQLM